MNKVVYNSKYGGYCLSLQAAEWLAENGREKIKVYVNLMKLLQEILKHKFIGNVLFAAIDGALQYILGLIEELGVDVVLEESVYKNKMVIYNINEQQ